MTINHEAYSIGINWMAARAYAVIDGEEVGCEVFYKDDQSKEPAMREAESKLLRFLERK